MLHMVVNTHNAESCAFRGEHEDEILTGAFQRLDELAPERGVEIKGTWINRAAHEIFMLVDAPTGHAVEEALLAAGLVGRTHTRVLAVFTGEAVLAEEYEHRH